MTGTIATETLTGRGCEGIRAASANVNIADMWKVITAIRQLRACMMNYGADPDVC
jgi:hypothetical protein